MEQQQLAKKFIEYVAKQDGLRVSPAGHMGWGNYLKSVCASAFSYTKLLDSANDLFKHVITRTATHTCPIATPESEKIIEALCVLDAPPRYVSTEISKAWQHTKIPKLNWNAPYVLPAYVIFPPCPIKEQKPEYFSDGWFLQSVMVIRRIDGLDAYATSTKWNTDLGVFQQQNHVVHLHADTDYNTLDASDGYRAMAMVAINSWLTQAFEPELITTDTLRRSSAGFGRRAKETRSPIAPTWIGRDFKVQRIPSPATPNEARIPVRPHWRSGHWHTVRHGKGREQTRLQWYRPVYVNASPD